MILYGTNPIAWSNDDDHSIGAHISLETCLRQAGEIGFDGIENGHKFPKEPEVLKTVLAEHGLRFVSGWYSLMLLERSVEDEKKVIQPWLDFLKAMGSPICIACECSNTVHGNDHVALNDRPKLDAEAMQRFGAAVEEVAKFCEAQGILLAYHHHMGTVVESETEIDAFMAVTGPSTRLLFDTGHAFFGGGDPAAIIARHMGRVVHIHAKNVRPDVMRTVREEGLSFLEGVRRGVFTVPGDAEGGVAFEPVLEVAARAGYAGWVVVEAEQDSALRDPATYQSMGLRALKDMARRSGLDQSETG